LAFGIENGGYGYSILLCFQLGYKIFRDDPTGRHGHDTGTKYLANNARECKGNPQSGKRTRPGGNKHLLEVTALQIMISEKGLYYRQHLDAVAETCRKFPLVNNLVTYADRNTANTGRCLHRQAEFASIDILRFVAHCSATVSKTVAL
jgi:hypothetical protein